MLVCFSPSEMSEQLGLQLKSSISFTLAYELLSVLWPIVMCPIVMSVTMVAMFATVSLFPVVVS